MKAIRRRVGQDSAESRFHVSQTYMILALLHERYDFLTCFLHFRDTPREDTGPGIGTQSVRLCYLPPRSDSCGRCGRCSAPLARFAFRPLRRRQSTLLSLSLVLWLRGPLRPPTDLTATTYEHFLSFLFGCAPFIGTSHLRGNSHLRVASDRRQHVICSRHCQFCQLHARKLLAEITCLVPRARRLPNAARKYPENLRLRTRRRNALRQLHMYSHSDN